MACGFWNKIKKGLSSAGRWFKNKIFKPLGRTIKKVGKPMLNTAVFNIGLPTFLIVLPRGLNILFLNHLPAELKPFLILFQKPQAIKNNENSFYLYKGLIIPPLSS